MHLYCGIWIVFLCFLVSGWGFKCEWKQNCFKTELLSLCTVFLWDYTENGNIFLLMCVKHCVVVYKYRKFCKIVKNFIFCICIWIVFLFFLASRWGIKCEWKQNCFVCSRWVTEFVCSGLVWLFGDRKHICVGAC